MGESKRTSLTVAKERVLLVGVILSGTNVDPMDPLGELRSLASTAGAQVVDEIIARRQSIHPGLYVGTGKAQEIAERAGRCDADTILFDNDLSPAQIRDLEELTGRKVLDRSELILDIFASHARTRESILQVELAQLEYTYPRLLHLWTHLERVAGGAATAAAAVGGIGTRGPGEKQLETDRRLVRKQLSHLKRQIAQIDGRKVRQIRARGETFRACIVGYTNAGKSTLMNALTDARAYVADKLFATLDTKTRRWNLGEGQSVLLSDTVGFIRDLPHHLVASFRATLEEAIWADLLLHVADASHDRVEQQISAVETVLAELGCAPKRQLLVLNKIDRIQDPSLYAVLSSKHPEAVFVSAVTGRGVDRLTAAVAFRAGGERVRVRLQANYRNGRLMHYIARHGRIESQQFNDSSAEIEVVMPQQRIDQLRVFGADVEVLSQSPAPR